ncbi:hypothetical protein C5167_004311, partial [Papaver somniferum]
YSFPPPDMIKDRSKKPPPAQDDSSTSPRARETPQHHPRTLDVGGLSQVSPSGLTRPPSSSLPQVDDSKDPTYLPDMKFLRDIFVTTRSNPSLRSAASESLTSLSSDSFLDADQGFIQNASFNLSSQEHPSLLCLGHNHSMSHLEELHESRDLIGRKNTRIAQLESQLAKEKNISSALRRSEQKLKDQVSYLREDVRGLNEDLDNSLQENGVVSNTPSGKVFRDKIMNGHKKNELTTKNLLSTKVSFTNEIKLSAKGLKLDVCTKNRLGLLSDITRVFRENGLSVSREEISTGVEGKLMVSEKFAVPHVLAIHQPEGSHQAVEHERNIRSNRPRNPTIFHHPALGDFELQHLPVGANDAELEERIIQHLAAAAAIGRAHHMSRRDGLRNRSSGQGRPQFLVFSSQPNATSSTPITATPAQGIRDDEPAHPVVAASPNFPLMTVGIETSSGTQKFLAPQADQSPTSASGSGHSAANQCRFSFSSPINSAGQSSPIYQDREGPSELQSFSETLKSKFNAVSTRYKESITKKYQRMEGEAIFSKHCDG